MIPIVLGAVALGATGYGVKKYIESDIDRSIAFGDFTQNIGESILNGIDKLFVDDYVSEEIAAIFQANEKIDKESIKQLSKLTQTVQEDTFKELETILKGITNLTLEEPKKINPKSDFIDTKEYNKKVYKRVAKIYNLLRICNALLKSHITKLQEITAQRDDYNEFELGDKKILSDALVLSNVICDLLNVKIINKENKPTKSSKKLIKDVYKMIGKSLKSHHSDHIVKKD